MKYRGLFQTLSAGVFGINERREPLGSDEPIAAGHQFSYLVPVYGADVQAKPNPTFGTNIGGHVKSVRLRGNQRRIVTR